MLCIAVLIQNLAKQGHDLAVLLSNGFFLKELPNPD
jgi:hypothetical protein